MIRAVLLLACMCASFHSGAVRAQEARLEATGAGLSGDWLGRKTLTLPLTQGVPYRVFMLDAPKRLVIDLRDVDAQAFSPDAFLTPRGPINGVRMGQFMPGWTRFIADLTQPVVPDEVSMRIDASSGAAVLQMSLVRASDSEFGEHAGPPPGVFGENVAAREFAVPDEDRFVVVIDPGHGGVDPGALRGDVSEKELVLTLALKMAERLKSSGVTDVYLTRETDVFVALDARVDLAQALQADLFLSLHADALREGGAEGATIYTLAAEASDAATAQLAARHNRADILAGADLTGQEDTVARVLLDLARHETQPRSDALARAIVTEMGNAGVPMNRHPLREAGFAVLKSADIPSVLVEVGFLSSPRDLANVQDPIWQAMAVEGLVASVMRWRQSDERRAALSR
ncbi:MAG: N-acetylmuramoyl-L-alanine amidase [Roseobacter sp.]